MAPAHREPAAVFIDDEFSSMTDEDHAAALAVWIAEASAVEAIGLPVTAAETLNEIPRARRIVTASVVIDASASRPADACLSDQVGP